MTNHQTNEPSTTLKQNYLGQQGTTEFDELDTFDVTGLVTLSEITFMTDEFTSVCPVTGQPDYSSVIIYYRPTGKAIESKSLKLFLMTFRDQGKFAEALADEICRTVFDAAAPMYVKVVLNQNPRGGIGLQTVAEWDHERP